MTRPTRVQQDTPQEARERIENLQGGLPRLDVQHLALAAQLRRPGGYRRWARENCWSVDIDPDRADELGAAMAVRLEAEVERHRRDLALSRTKGKR